jgi:hypothetical protein
MKLIKLRHYCTKVWQVRIEKREIKQYLREMRKEPEVRELNSRRLGSANTKNSRTAREQKGRKNFLTVAARYL